MGTEDDNTPVLCTGFPGSGKTTDLKNYAIEKLRSGNTVLVLSTWHGSILSSLKIYDECVEAVQENKNSVYFYHFLINNDISKLEKEMKDLSIKATNQVFVVIDNVYDGPVLQKLFTLMKKEANGCRVAIRELKCYTAKENFKKIKPPSVPMRLPFFEYESSQAQSDIFKIVQHNQHGKIKDPLDCEQCGNMVARLLSQWDIGKPNGIRFQDVFILVRNDALQLNEKMGFLKGLRSEQRTGTTNKDVLLERQNEPGAPEDLSIRVLTYDRLKSFKTNSVDNIIAEVALNKGANDITVATEFAVRGLKRKVVVWVGVWERDYYDTYDRQYASACATERLVWVRAPRSIDLDNSESDTSYSSDGTDD